MHELITCYLSILKGSDKRNLKYLLVEKSENTQNPDDPYLHRQCVVRCENVSGYRTFFNRCIPIKVNAQPLESLLSRTGMVSFFQEVSEDLTECWREVIYACIVAFGNWIMNINQFLLGKFSIFFHFQYFLSLFL